MRPGDVVLDLGTGSGVLAIAAARAGARRVYAVEASDIAEVAQRVFAANGVTDTVTLVPGWSREIELPEPADLLVAELIGNEPFEEEILETTLDARRRLLKPDARLIPHSLTLLARPLRLPEGDARQRTIGRAALERWRRLYDMEFQPLLDAARTGPVNMPAEAEVVANWPPVGPAATLAALDLTAFEEASVEVSADLVVDAPGVGECCRGHVPSRPLRDDRAHRRSLEVADLELGDVGLGASRPAERGAGSRASCAVLPAVRWSTRLAQLRDRRALVGATGPRNGQPKPTIDDRRFVMGMVRRRTRRRTMLVAGGAAYAAGRATQGGQYEEDVPQQEVPPAPPPPAPTSGATETDELQRLADMHAAGTLTDEEFASAKAGILGM